MQDELGIFHGKIDRLKEFVVTYNYYRTKICSQPCRALTAGKVSYDYPRSTAATRGSFSQ